MVILPGGKIPMVGLWNFPHELAVPSHRWQPRSLRRRRGQLGGAQDGPDDRRLSDGGDETHSTPILLASEELTACTRRNTPVRGIFRGWRGWQGCSGSAAVGFGTTAARRRACGDNTP
ncbi:MAG: hypothetical protein EOO77_08240 [Oxalobacteraceae bacterium]|nr:MAG: hypothetical protein EOO77_08240 [Oxalobacteraceae bacterium]